jgi:hypothetical protein
LEIQQKRTREEGEEEGGHFPNQGKEIEDFHPASVGLPDNFCLTDYAKMKG